MNKKDRYFLLLATLGALSLSVLALTAENRGAFYKANETSNTHYCASIVFGTTQYGSNGAVTTSTFTTQNITVDSISTSTNCYAASGNAARIGESGGAGELTFSFGTSTSYVITEAWVWCYEYSTDAGNNKSATFSLATSALSADNFQSVTATSCASSTTSTDPSILTASGGLLHFTGLDAGSGTASTSLTVKSTTTARVELCKVLLKITGTASNGDYINDGGGSVTKSLSSISVTSNPTKSSYTKGETLDTTGLVITADYSDSSSADVTSACTLSPDNGTTLNTVGTQTISVSYTYSGTTKTTSFTVTVTAASVTLSSIAVTSNPTKTSYNVGDILDTAGCVITATYSDESTSDVTSSCDFSPTTLSTSGTQVITVTYSGKTASFSVSVAAAKTLSSITISGTATTTSYTAGESFDPTGLTVTATYSDNSTAVVTSSVTWTPSTLSAGDTSVTASYTYGSTTKTAAYNGLTVSAASGTYMYTKKSGDHLQVFAIEQTGTYGDATLFKYGNFEILIDGGNTTSQTQLQHYLETYCTDHVIDILVLTHPHTDHYGSFYGGTATAANGGVMADAGITAVSHIIDDGLDSYGSGYISNWVNGVRSHYTVNSNYQSISTIVSGHTYDAIWNITPSIYIQWLDSGTYATEDSTSANNNSVCCDLHFGTYEYVMVGDAQDTEVNSLMSNYSGTNKFIKSTDTVIFKACHHCSGTADSGNTSTFLNYVSPSYGWASAGITSANAAKTTPSTAQHPYKNGATSITNKTGTANFYWNGTAGTLDMTLDESFANFSIVGEGRVYGYGYKMSGTLVDANSEKTTPLFSTQWATTSAFANGAGGTL
jgi:beta-lactamase superfamily II metal-dependent hydrolase